MSEFAGFEKPKYTQVPNDLIDVLMPLLSGAELKVALFVARKTFGWHKETDVLSLQQLVDGTGLSKPSVLSATTSLVDRGLLIKRERGQNIAHEYSLNVQTSKDILLASENTSKEILQVEGQTSKEILPQLVKKVYTQKKVLKKEIKDSAADAAPPQEPVQPSKKRATKGRKAIQTEPEYVPPAAPPVAPEQAAADLAAWDALEAAPDDVRHGRAPTFPNDHFGWYEGLILVTTGWTRREFEQRKSESVQKAYHAHAKKHHELGRNVKTLLENFSPGGWRYQAHEYRTSKPNLGEIDQLWGDWEQTPVLTFPTPAAPRPAYVPPPLPDDVVKLPQDRRRELRRLGVLQAGGLNGNRTTAEKHAG